MPLPGQAPCNLRTSWYANFASAMIRKVARAAPIPNISLWCFEARCHYQKTSETINKNTNKQLILEKQVLLDFLGISREDAIAPSCASLVRAPGTPVIAIEPVS